MTVENFRVWPDGTVQPVDEEPYSWMSDDFVIVNADDSVIDEIAEHYRINGNFPGIA